MNKFEKRIRIKSKLNNHDGENKRILYIPAVFFLLCINLLIFRSQILNHTINKFIFANTGDPCLNLYILEHGFKSIIHHKLTNFFEINILFPSKLGLTFTEHLIGHQVFYIPIRIISKNPLISYNLLTILNYYICSIGTFFFGYFLFKNLFSSLFFAISFTYSSMLIQQIGHFQISSIPWIGFLFLFLLKYLKTSNWKYAYLCLFFWILQSLDSFYIGYMVSISIFIVLLSYLILTKMWKDKRFWINVSIIIIIYLICIIPFSLPYITTRDFYNFKRSIGENAAYSADFPLSFIHPSYYNSLFLRIPESIRKLIQITNGWEKTLFTGYIVIFTLIYFFTSMYKSKEKYNDLHKIFIISGIVFFILSLGPVLNIFNVRIKIPLPYLVLYTLVPGFSSMRVPGRFGIIYLFCIIALSSYGFTRLFNKISRSYLKIIVAITLLSITVFELLPVFPMGFIGDIPDVIKNLKFKENTYSRTFAYLPAERFKSPDKNNLEFNPFLSGKYIYYTAFHNQDVINGYSGFITEGTIQAQSYLADMLNPISLSNLEKLGVKYFIVLPFLMKNHEINAMKELIDSGSLKLQERFNDGSSIYKINVPNDYHVKKKQNLILLIDCSKENILIVTLDLKDDDVPFISERRDIFETVNFILYDQNGDIMFSSTKKTLLPAIINHDFIIIYEESRNIKNEDINLVEIHFETLNKEIFVPILKGKTEQVINGI